MSRSQCCLRSHSRNLILSGHHQHICLLRLGPCKMHLPVSQSLAATHVPQFHCRALETFLPRSFWTLRPVQLHLRLELLPAPALGGSWALQVQGGESTARPSWKLLTQSRWSLQERERRRSAPAVSLAPGRSLLFRRGRHRQFLWPTRVFTLLATFCILFGKVFFA